MCNSEKLILNKHLVESYDPPPGFPELSDYGWVLQDKNCGETIGWGFRILRHLGEDRFRSLGKYGDLECLSTGEWVLVYKWLTPEEAIERFGPITHQLFGPMGGWKSTTYGKKTFSSRQLKPTTELENKFTYEKEVLEKKSPSTRNELKLTLNNFGISKLQTPS